MLTLAYTTVSVGGGRRGGEKKCLQTQWDEEKSLKEQQTDGKHARQDAATRSFGAAEALQALRHDANTITCYRCTDRAGGMCVCVRGGGRGGWG